MRHTLSSRLGRLGLLAALALPLIPATWAADAEDCAQIQDDAARLACYDALDEAASAKGPEVTLTHWYPARRWEFGPGGANALSGSLVEDAGAGAWWQLSDTEDEFQAIERRRQSATIQQRPVE